MIEIILYNVIKNFMPWSHITKARPHVLQQCVACARDTSPNFLVGIGGKIGENKLIKGKMCMFSFHEHQQKYN